MKKVLESGIQIEEIWRPDMPKDLNDLPVQIYRNRVIARGGVFSDKEIKVALELGHIICQPEPVKINGSSIDVTLGRYFYHAGAARYVDNIFNPFDEQDVNRYFGKPLEAKPLAEARHSLETEKLRSTEYLEGIPDDHPIIILRPGERILAHTNEFIGIRPPGTTSMQSRSTTGRIGLASCFCAGWGDPGYVNRWTMEINNLNEREYIVIPVGFRTAQIAFHMTGPIETEYANLTGKYQDTDSSNIQAVISNWQPSHMLPKAYKDEVIKRPAPNGLNPDYI